jgi:hypothetical protein
MRNLNSRSLGRLAGAFAVSLLVAPLLAATAARAMDFSTVALDGACTSSQCSRAVVADGEITREAPAEFARFLRSQLQTPGLHAIVFLNSPGGNVESSLQLGSLLHSAGAAVVVGKPAALPERKRPARSAMGKIGVLPGHCASACVYALMGAKKRVVPNGARVGVHRMSARLWGQDPAGGGVRNTRVFAGSPEIDALRSYVAKVGGSQELISLAESVPHDRIRMLSGSEVRKYRLGSPSL